MLKNKLFFSFILPISVLTTFVSCNINAHSIDESEQYNIYKKEFNKYQESKIIKNNKNFTFLTNSENTKNELREFYIIQNEEDIKQIKDIFASYIEKYKEEKNEARFKNENLYNSINYQNLLIYLNKLDLNNNIYIFNNFAKSRDLFATFQNLYKSSDSDFNKINNFEIEIPYYSIVQKNKNELIFNSADLEHYLYLKSKNKEEPIFKTTEYFWPTFSYTAFKISKSLFSNDELNNLQIKSKFLNYKEFREFIKK
ncbi:hypothetical protein ACR34G_03735 [Mycoplasma sp. 480]|uniref:hypothetical protein n=1 Tax=Mycoplasma sp. 480 TaxID=3440155 RepID=UPI003F5170BC